MISGRLALGGLSLEFGKARKAFDELSPRVQELAETHTRLLAQEEDLIHELAQVYLPELSPEAVAGGLAEMREDAREALRVHERHRAELTEKLARADKEVARKQEAVLELEGEEAALAETLAERAEAVRAILEGDAELRRRVAEHDTLMAREEVLKGRRSRLASVGRYECRRYESYRPFAYLLGRGYGTPDYRAGALGRRLDRWLARRIGFEALHRSYLILRDGSGLIHREVLQLREAAAELESWIDARESEVGAREGLLEAAEASAAAEARLADARAVLEEKRVERDSLVAALQAVEVNRGATYERLLKRHEDFLGSQSMSELAQRAMDTADPRDDVLVQELQETRRRLIDTGRELATHRRELDRLARLTGRLAEAKRVASSRFYSRRSRFPEEFRLEKALAPLLEGDRSAAQLVDHLTELHVTESALGPPGGPGAGLTERLTHHLDGLLAGISSSFGQRTEVVETLRDGQVETDYVVFGPDGQVLERRVTRRVAGSSTED